MAPPRRLHPRRDLRRLDEHWETFLAEGAIEGWYHLPLPDGRVLPVEFSATANVLPGRHLSVVMPQPGGTRDPEGYSAVRFKRGRMVMAGQDAVGHLPAVTKPVLTDREREVLGLVAGGLTGGEIAQQLVVSPGDDQVARAERDDQAGRAHAGHAVAISLRDGQIDPVHEDARRSRGTHSERQVGHPPVRARAAAAAAVTSAFGGGREGIETVRVSPFSHPDRELSLQPSYRRSSEIAGHGAPWRGSRSTTTA